MSVQSGKEIMEVYQVSWPVQHRIRYPLARYEPGLPLRSLSKPWSVEPEPLSQTGDETDADPTTC